MEITEQWKSEKKKNSEKDVTQAPPVRVYGPYDGWSIRPHAICTAVTYVLGHNITRSLVFSLEQRHLHV